ncbi:inorganic polyphosphate kinase [Erythrobacter longus]|uniref:NAD kinase n=1 Tax=Erythrobacter longus TaxID=1044 RepID=A0A074MH92_ERYLO|nr:NAD kinase [Erythrobacter longus]KEO91228.1 inorganic polyphosphate kinase [Erythrobacter longus]
MDTAISMDADGGSHDAAINRFEKVALVASETPRAQEAFSKLYSQRDWVPLHEADAVVVLGGDGFMLHTLHNMLDMRRIVPAYGMNRGTVGFLMNRYDNRANVTRRLEKARGKTISPLRITAVTQDGEMHKMCAINELSLLRETRQTAKIEVTVGSRVRIEELVGDGVLVSTPAGSTAYNLSANGPILPLDSSMLALTPISPFRPRRWRGAILPDEMRITLRVLEPAKRPVAAVADQKELRDIAEVSVDIDHSSALELLFDPGQSLAERIVSEQFAVD